MHLSFAKDRWSTGEFTYAYSRRFEETPVFTQRDEYVESLADPAAVYGYENISFVTAEKVPVGTKITTRCAFFGDGAPLILLAKDLVSDSRSVLRYGDYFEVVLYKNGINVWRLRQDPAGKPENGYVVWHKRLGAEFPVEEGVPHELVVQTAENTLKITVDGSHSLTLRTEDLFPAFHAGIDACEGINRFWSLDVE